MTMPEPIVHSHPEIFGGEPVFVGTRVPLRFLIEHLEAGDSLDVFLYDFPSVRRSQVVAALRLLETFPVPRANPS